MTQYGHVHVHMTCEVPTTVSLVHLGQTAEAYWGRYPHLRQETTPRHDQIMDDLPVMINGDATFTNSCLFMAVGGREYAFVMATKCDEDGKFTSYVIMFERTGYNPGRSRGDWRQHEYIMTLTSCQACKGIGSFAEVTFLTLVSAFNPGYDNDER